MLGREDYLDAARDVRRLPARGHARRRRPAAAHLQATARPALNAYLEDHAFLLEALLTLYEATFEARWFVAARDARRRDDRPLRRPRARRLLHHLRRPRGADRPPQGPRGPPDPSGNSSAALGLLRLARSPASAPTRSGARPPAASCTRSPPSIRRPSATCCRRSTCTSRRRARSRSSAGDGVAALARSRPLRAAPAPRARRRAAETASARRGRRCSRAARRRRPRRRLRLRELRLPRARDRARRARGAATPEARTDESCRAERRKRRGAAARTCLLPYATPRMPAP